jgi:hypothetical protein
MIRKCCNGIFGKSVEFCSLLGNKNFYHIQLSVIISMFVEVRSELGGAASGLTILFSLDIFAGYKYYLFRPLDLANKTLFPAVVVWKVVVGKEKKVEVEKRVTIRYKNFLQNSCNIAIYISIYEVLYAIVITCALHYFIAYK